MFKVHFVRFSMHPRPRKIQSGNLFILQANSRPAGWWLTSVAKPQLPSDNIPDTSSGEAQILCSFILIKIKWKTGNLIKGYLMIQWHTNESLDVWSEFELTYHWPMGCQVNQNPHTIWSSDIWSELELTYHWLLECQIRNYYCHVTLLWQIS